MRDLLVIVPVYNEAGCISDVLREWTAALEALGINFEIRVYNDGSKDRTGECLKAWEAHPRVRVTHQANAGHGPTIHRGYREAVDEAEWIFQMDGDGEIPAAEFPRFWRERDRADGLFGIRVGRRQGWARGLISRVSRAVVKLLAGNGVEDVNVPFRLLRAASLRAVLPLIPPSTFAPNLALSGMMGRGRFRVLNFPVPHEGRKTGSVSLVKWKMWRAAFRSFRETTLILWKHRQWPHAS